MKDIVYKLIILIFIFLGDLITVKAQTYTINWISDSILIKNKIVAQSDFFPRFSPQKFGDIPSVYLKIPVSSINNRVEIQLVDVSGAVLNNKHLDYNKIATDIQLNYHTVLENKKPFLLIQFLPIIKTEGGLQKVNRFSVQINALKQESTSKTTLKTYANSSVLATGNWYKIAVKDEGIYKLSYDFLSKLGIDVATVNPKNIRLYGNGGFMLPQSNVINRADDLQENAIEVFGEEDLKFNTTDYVLFYANGNTKWSLNSNSQYFEHQNNTYSDSSYYYINIDKGLGKRVTAASATTQSPNYFTDVYDDYQLHEKDLYTLITSNIKSGRNWYGEDFEFNTSRAFNFNVSGIKSSTPIAIKVAMAIRSNINSSASFSANNQSLSPLNAAGVPLNFETNYATQVISNQVINSVSSNNVAVNITYNKPNSNSNAWLDFIEVNCKRQLSLQNSYLRFRDKASIGLSNITQFNISNTLNTTKIWDITEAQNPKSISLVGTSFITTTPILKEFVSFNPSAYKEPEAIGKITNQNLHGLAAADFLIISPPEFYNEAKRLADFRKEKQSLSYQIVTPTQVFNEFSSGIKDATAIRDFVKMFYDRANLNSSIMPKYLLLFGKGSFDHKGIKFRENNFVVTYQSENSLSPTESYTSDDYFALLDDNEGDFPEDYINNPGLLDIAVGRIPVKTLSEAKNVVDKLINYSSINSFGDWRNQVAIIADDEDNNLHLNQAEANANLITSKNQNINLNKIYFDAYRQESLAGGTRYPNVEQALNESVNTGSLLINYTGHGGESGWAQERVLTVDQINKWNNKNYLPIIFTATCSFSRWDDPEITSAGELALIKKDGGIPSLFSTTRIVFASYNFDLNQSFLKALFDIANVGKPISFGDVFKAAKNNNVGGLNINSRNFTLLGDPTALFPIPLYKIETTSLADTLKAGQKVTIKGIITNQNGQHLNNFNGFVFPTVYDKPNTIRTLGQDNQVNGSFVQAFNIQNNILYKGKASVNGGLFKFDFVIPKDIIMQYGNGKISYYGDNNLLDASGNTKNFIVGGISPNSESDKVGPIMQVYLNDERFVSGGITNNNPVLIVKLNDENGINTTGIGIGHDIVATLSTALMNDKNIVLNEFYQSTLDSYQQGTINYPLNNLSTGLYTLKIKAWDVFNNSSEQTITFEVKNSERLAIAHVLNYPNPFTTKTSFQFEHNYPNEDLEVQINIKTITGRLVKTINQTVNSPGNRVDNIFWDGKDNFGDILARGIYVYELKIRSSLSKDFVKQIEKLVLL